MPNPTAHVSSARAQTAPPREAVAAAIGGAVRRAEQRLLEMQRPDGHWRAWLETDTSVTSEFLLTCRHVGQVDEDRERRIVNYLSARQEADGGWRIHPLGGYSHDTTIKAYAAMKAAGVPASDARLTRARRLIVENGGVEAAACFTKIQLAIVGEMSWEAVPCIPPEMLLLPRTAPFNVYEMSYWCRTIMVPLTIVQAIRKPGHLPRDRGVGELFMTASGPVRETLERGHDWFSWRRLFYLLDRAVKGLEPMSPQQVRQRSLHASEKWILERLEDTDGLGGIIPAMLNTVLALWSLGRSWDDPVLAKAWKDLLDLAVPNGDELWMQPCLSPVWDTALATLALAECGSDATDARLGKAADWLLDHRVTRPGDWRVKAPKAPASAWTFQYRNDHYPDIDDTAMVVHALKRSRSSQPRHQEAATASATEWCRALQSRNGGWGAFDRNNDRLLLQHVPFADHGALLDAPTPDITGRVLELLGAQGARKDDAAVAKGLAYLRREQETEGSWFGRWGVNYVYGTWSVLAGLAAVRLPPEDPMVAAAADWLESVQNADGGWGETPDSYVDRNLMAKGPSTPSQSAWAMLGLMAAERDGDALLRGAQHLLSTQSADGTWVDAQWVGTGFPGVLYLRYHLYPVVFPLLALARVRARLEGGSARR